MKLILQILLIILIISTLSICVMQPDMHKNLMVYDSDYTLVPEQDVKVETKDIPVMEIPAKPVTKVIVAETIVKPEVKTVNTQTKNTKNQTTTVPKNVPVAKQSTVNQKKQTVTKQTNPVEPIAQKVIEKKEAPKVIQKIETIQKEQPQTKVMTQQEETIAWNKWRSNLTNQIMSDTRLPEMPDGVLFQFSFNVDKYGKVSNVQTGANPANYTPYAIQYIAPVIRSYQGRSILNFPEGTARTSTQVTGKWRISSTEKYSTPQDYNDIERIKK